VVEGNGAAAEKDEGECESGETEGEFVPAGANHSVVEMDLQDGDGEIDADSDGGDAGEQAQQQEQAAEEFGEGGKISAPGWKPEMGDHINVVVESAENLVVSVDKHDGAESETHDEEREGLQAIEVAQVVPPAKER
jgi:hypothetical protein